MKHPRLPWKRTEYGNEQAEIDLAPGLWLYASVRPLESRWEWRVSVCGATADGNETSRASAMRAVRDRLRIVHQFLNAWEKP
jgi:hypothetical protein